MIDTNANKTVDANTDSRLAYILDGVWRETNDQRIHPKYPLMAGGPVPLLLIVAAYVYSVRRSGPTLMRSRGPFDLRWTIRMYNISMGLINLRGFWRVGLLTRFGTSVFGCKQIEPEAPEYQELIQWGYVYFVTKLCELLETIFFVLRKKTKQVSNLHVFHHSFMVICTWLYFKIAPGGSSVLFPFINAGVHALMYGYYFLATFEPMQKHLWWKRHLTQVQMVQFVVCMMHFSVQGLQSSCNYPAAMSLIGFTFNFVFFVLFYSFYSHAYLAPKKPANLHQQQPRQQKKLL